MRPHLGIGWELNTGMLIVVFVWVWLPGWKLVVGREGVRSFAGEPPPFLAWRA